MFCEENGILIENSIHKIYISKTKWNRLWQNMDNHLYHMESRLLGEMSIISDMQIPPPLWQKTKRNSRASWWKWKRSEKVGLNLHIQKTKITASSPITSWQIDGETMETVTDFILLSPKITTDNTAAMKLKEVCSLEENLWQS